MSALPIPLAHRTPAGALAPCVEVRLETLTIALLDTLLAVEQRAYSHPWTRGNFIDAMASGYQAQLLMAGDHLLGYFVAMMGVDEVHLLNLTVAPEFQRQGWARVLLDALALWSRGQRAQWLWLRSAQATSARSTFTRRTGFAAWVSASAITPPTTGNAKMPWS